jgi:hypothetical protein
MSSPVFGDALPAGNSADKILLKHSVVKLRRYFPPTGMLVLSETASDTSARRIVVTPPHTWSAQTHPHSNEIFGSGEMAGLTLERNWAATPLGPIERWPQALIVLVNVILANPHPMFLWWGAELTQFYNDAYRQSLGSDKQPGRARPARSRLLAGNLAHHRPAN